MIHLDEAAHLIEGAREHLAALGFHLLAHSRPARRHLTGPRARGPAA